MRGGFLGLVIRNTRVDVLCLLDSTTKRAVQAVNEFMRIYTVVFPNRRGMFTVQASGKYIVKHLSGSSQQREWKSFQILMVFNCNAFYRWLGSNNLKNLSEDLFTGQDELKYLWVLVIWHLFKNICQVICSNLSLTE